MSIRQYPISKRFITLLHGVVFCISFALPALLMGLSLKQNRTFELSFLTLMGILAVVIFITLYHEGRKWIASFRLRYLEVSNTRVLIHRPHKKELIFFDELEKVEAHRSPSGNVNALVLKTIYGTETKLSYYEGLLELSDLIHRYGEVEVSEKESSCFTRQLVSILSGLFVGGFIRS